MFMLEFLIPLVLIKFLGGCINQNDIAHKITFMYPCRMVGLKSIVCLHISALSMSALIVMIYHLTDI